MGAPFSSLAVANRFVEIANKRGCDDLTLMKLLKLVYFAHGWHLGLTGKPLVDEFFEAWQFGPVAPQVYHNFKHVGTSPITAPANSLVKFNMQDLDVPIELETPSMPSDPRMEEFMGKIWETYGGLTAYQLSELTHQAGTPWHHVWFAEGGSQRKHAVIPDGEIEEFFREKAHAKRAA